MVCLDADAGSDSGVDSSSSAMDSSAVDSATSMDSSTTLDSSMSSDSGTCSLPEISCGGTCVDPSTSQDYCGATGNCTGANAGTSCNDTPAMGAHCYAGVCGCPPGTGQESGYCQTCSAPTTLLCSGSCVDPTTNANCGTCGNACTGTQTCVSGMCTSPATPDSGTDSGGAPGDGGAPTGYIVLQQCNGPPCASSFSFSAGFDQTTTGCTTTASGACTYMSCSGPATTSPGVSAGTLTVSGGFIPAGTIVPFNAGYYDAINGSLFTAGQTLTVSAPGSTVPAFASSITAPAVISLMLPTGFTISTSAALSVTWTGGQAGATVLLAGLSDDGSDQFECMWDASLGQATVPQSILAGLAGQSTGTLTWGQYSTKNFTAGAYAITEEALQYGSGAANFTP